MREVWGNYMHTGMDYVIINPWEERRQQEVGLADVTIPQSSGKKGVMILQNFKSNQIHELQ